MIIIEKTGTGSSISGDAVMMDKYGDVHDVIDDAYHPNPGTEEDGYGEIERCIDWLVSHDLASFVDSDIMNWLRARTYQVQSEYHYDDSQIDELVSDIMYDDNYEVNDEIVRLIREYKRNADNEDSIDYDEMEDEALEAARNIANYINQNFLRIRAGGKLNPEGTDTIYFRISSHGFDWHRNIVDFLWNTFDSIEKMPKEIIICYDEETRGSDKILYQGSPEDLFFYNDGKLFERDQFKSLRFS